MKRKNCKRRIDWYDGFEMGKWGAYCWGFFLI